jgi:anti-sigma regulatory factor (Ser/Thr protein kinase)
MQAWRPFLRPSTDLFEGVLLVERYQIAQAAELTALTAFRGLIDRVCREQPSVDPETCYDLKLAVEEACTNVVTHGYAGMNPGSVVLSLELDSGQIRVILTDFGHPFEPYDPGAPDLEAGLDEELLHGFGLHLIYQLMDEVGYESCEDGNHLTFIKRLPHRQKR